jgi:LacI family transcriptional regulator
MVTIKDVAREAGVSVATVSRVWNGSAVVSDATRSRVEAVTTRLGYVPNSAARSLITSRTSTIGVLLPDLHGEFFSELIRGIDQTARRSGFHLLVSSSHSDGAEVDFALRSMRGRVDGLIVMSTHAEARAAMRQLPPAFPVVALNAIVDGATTILTIQNYEGALAMVRHLITLGHDPIAMIGGPDGNDDAMERRRGYRDALAEAGLASDAALESAGAFDEQSGYRAATELLGRSPRPRAIFAANDAMAIGAISALHEHGLEVPGDMAIAGFDDIPMARYMSPPLTSVRVNIPALGERAARRLLEAIDDIDGKSDMPRSRSVRREAMKTSLVIRRSCGAPATGLEAPLHPRGLAPRGTN